MMTILFKKRKNISKNESDHKNLLYRDILNELETKFQNYDFGELAFDECFGFICKNCSNMQEAIIISSMLRQIEPTVSDIKLVYNLDDHYIDNLIQNKLSELRVLAYNKLEIQPNNEVIFFPGFHNDFTSSYSDLITRIEYLFEVKRNTKALLKDKIINTCFPHIINNNSLLYLLNYLSIKDSLIVCSSLDIADIDEEVLSSVYSYEDSYLVDIFDRYVYMIMNDLSQRIKKLEATEIETSYFDYNSLCNEYKDLYERINDTLDYLNIKNKTR